MLLWPAGQLPGCCAGGVWEAVAAVPTYPPSRLALRPHAARAAAGIGENSAPMRAEFCRGLEFAGLRLDGGKNEAAPRGAAVDVSAAGSRVKVRVCVCVLVGGLRLRRGGPGCPCQAPLLLFYLPLNSVTFLTKLQHPPAPPNTPPTTHYLNHRCWSSPPTRSCPSRSRRCK
jgi:hypothetical protein